MASSTRSKVAEYTLRPLEFDAKLVEQVMARRKAGESLSSISKDLKMAQGKVAMAELVGTTPRKSISDPAALGRAVVKDRQAGDSWGRLAARYGITEGTCRAAYTAAAVEDWKLDRPAAGQGRGGGGIAMTYREALVDDYVRGLIDQRQLEDVMHALLEEGLEHVPLPVPLFGYGVVPPSLESLVE